MRFSFAITMAYLKIYIFLKEVAKDKANRRFTVMTFSWYPFSQ